MHAKNPAILNPLEEFSAPLLAEWRELITAVIDRANLMIAIYTSATGTMPTQAERQRRSASLQTLKERLHASTALYEVACTGHDTVKGDDHSNHLTFNAPTDREKAARAAYKKVCGTLLRSFLPELPTIAVELQSMLKSPWRKPRGEAALRLFLGAQDNPRIGLRSGHVTDGGLPAWIDNILTREAEEGEHSVCRLKDVPRSDETIHPPFESQQDMASRTWRRLNRAALCSAGRIS